MERGAGSGAPSRGTAQRRGDPAQRAWAATTVHAWYTALETTLEWAIRQVDGDVRGGPESRRRLLEQASLEAPGLRPAMVPASALRGLFDVLAFRHFFRNAYAVELDPARLEENLRRVVRHGPEVHEQLARLSLFLTGAAAAAE